MTHLQVLLIATITWIVWVPAAALDYRARHAPGGVSIFPAPFMPLFFWGVAYIFHRANVPSAVTAIGVLHLVYLAWMIVSMILSGWNIYCESKDFASRDQGVE
jgi:hypothetical protein